MDSSCTYLIAGIAASLWLILILLLHLIKPELKPGEHMVSEYARKPKGWFMLIAFISMAISCFALALALWPVASHVGVTLLAIVGAGFVGLGTFVTDPVLLTKDAKHTRSGSLHDLFGAIVILLFPVMATIVGLSIKQNIAWFALTWLGVIGFIGSMAYTMMRPNRRLIFGYFQRFMILTYTAWIVATAFLYIPATPSDAAILACHSENPSGAVATPIANNSVQYVKDTTRLFINTPKSLYPKDILHSWTTVSGNATGGYISNGGLPGEAFDATPDCWSTYVELDGNGEVDLRVKSIVSGRPDYFVRFIVLP